MSISVTRLDPSCAKDVDRAVSIITKSFSSHSVGSAMSGWDDTVMFDAYKDHLTNEPDIWHAYLAKRDGVIIGTAVVVPPGKTPSSAKSELRARLPENVRKWQDETLFPKMEASDKDSFGEEGTTPHLYLALIGVDPEVRRSGAGTVLLDHLKAEAKSQGVSMVLQSEDGSLIDYYRKAGFTTLKQDELPVSLDGKVTKTYCLIRE